MSPPTTAPNADLILAKTHLALAKSQRLIATWLPPPTTTESSGRQTLTAAEQEREETALFTPVPERLGLGAPLPADNSGVDGEGRRGRGEAGSDERLRRRLLGREMARIQGRTVTAAVGGRGVAVVKRPVGKRRVDGKGKGEEEGEEEERGRSSVGRAKRRVGGGGGGDGDGDGDGDGRTGGDGDGDGDGDGVEVASGDGKGGKLSGDGARRAAGSYLDQVLAENAAKKRRKKRRKESGGMGLQ